FELRRVKQFGLERRIEVDVFDGGKEGGFAFVGPAAVYEDEGRVLVAGIPEHVFEIEDIALAEAEIIADAHGGMKVHGKLQFAGLQDHDAENVVLKETVLVGGRNAAIFVFGVDGGRLFSRRIAEIKSAKVSGFELHGNAAALLIVLHRAADEIFIICKDRRQSRHVHLFFVAEKHFFLEWNVDAHIRSAGLLVAVVERIEKRIAEEDPVKARRVEIGSHGGAVG